ncbi:MAG TPA: DHHA1 domain-containing protein, partial [Gemmatimonadaceae bacterium]
DEEALGLARICEELNRERQEMDRKILDEAMKRVERLDLDATYGIVLADPTWHSGVIGIVASRIVEQVSRPTFLIALQDGVGKGSGRSIPAFDLHSALQACGDLLVKHGGHRAAAGLTVEASQVDAFAKRFNDVALDRLKPEDLVRELRVDLDLPLSDATEDLEKILRHMEPFGVGNPGPLFVAEGVRVTSNATKIGANGVKFFVDGARGPVEAVGWGMSERSAELRAGASVDIAYKLERNEFRGRSTLQLGLVDFK